MFAFELYAGSIWTVLVSLISHNQNSNTQRCCFRQKILADECVKLSKMRLIGEQKPSKYHCVVLEGIFGGWGWGQFSPVEPLFFFKCEMVH